MSTPGIRPLVLGNWKMNLTADESDSLVGEILRGVAAGLPCSTGVAPAFPYLARVAATCRGTDLAVGAQDVHWEPGGAFTGAVSTAMVRDVGASFVLVGHSERRLYFGETDETARRKVAAATAIGLDVVLCVGETEAERDRGEAVAVVERQLRGALDGLAGDAFSGVRVAYEPVWAIGTGRTPTEAEVAEIHGAIRSRVGKTTPILYGGSVNPGNAAGILAVPDVDGALVGGASLRAESFLAIALAAGLPGSGPA